MKTLEDLNTKHCEMLQIFRELSKLTKPLYICAKLRAEELRNPDNDQLLKLREINDWLHALADSYKFTTPANESMRLLSREDASKIYQGKYFTGNPCDNGHIAQRYTGSMVCVKCHRTSKVSSSETVAICRKLAAMIRHAGLAKSLGEYEALNPECQQLLHLREIHDGIQRHMNKIRCK